MLQVVGTLCCTGSSAASFIGDVIIPQLASHVRVSTIAIQGSIEGCVPEADTVGVATDGTFADGRISLLDQGTAVDVCDDCCKGGCLIVCTACRAARGHR